MKRRGLVISGAVLMVLIMVVYIYLGGLNSVEYTVENVADYNLIGVPFKGKGDSPEIEDIFVEAREYVTSGELEGVLTLVHYNDTTLADDELKMFIGLKLEEGTSDIPNNYQRLTIPARNAVRASIEAHNFVMPSPGSIESKMRETASQSNLELQDFTIEQYISENLLLIDMPVR